MKKFPTNPILEDRKTIHPKSKIQNPKSPDPDVQCKETI